MKIFNVLKSSIKNNITAGKSQLASNYANYSAGNKKSIFNSDVYQKAFTKDLDKQIKSLSPEALKKLEAISESNRILVSSPAFSGSLKTEKLMKNAKDKCVKALNSDNPREVLVLVDKAKSSVIGEFEGAFDKCYIPSSAISKINKNTVGLHGHPNFVLEGRDFTAPISFQDLTFLNKTKLAKYTAFNKNGEFSSLSKTPAFKTLSEAEMGKLESEYFNHLLNSLPKTEMKLVKELLLRYKNNNDFYAGEAVLGMVNDFQLSKQGMQATDTFWKNMAGKLGLNYETDFSYLT